MRTSRTFTPQDRLWITLNDTLTTLWGIPAGTGRPSPAQGHPPTLTPAEQHHAAQLLRVDHAGEVCAQGLYQGHAWASKDPITRASFLQAAEEESDHLRWCATRLTELNSYPSVLNPIWYIGSVTLGVIAGQWGQGWDLGFVVETEQQVEAHLAEHLQALPAADHASRAILEQMQIDERTHAAMALAAGGRALPWPARLFMRLTAKIMTTTARFV